MDFHWLGWKIIWVVCLIGNIYYMKNSESGTWWKSMHFASAFLSALYLLGFC